MKNTILLLLAMFLLTSCADDNEVNNLPVTSSNCEAIHDWDGCIEAGCSPHKVGFYFLSSDKSTCLEKRKGSICLAIEPECGSNTILYWGERELEDHSFVLFSQPVSFACIDGWNDTSYFMLESDVCAEEDPESASMEYTGSYDDWYPFE
ncbi:hypothetical protein KKF34_20170 [Myxococcota bacterium]|nr:hypothetical protein [Myxococcota bacterium]